MTELRPYQVASVEAIERELAAKASTLLVLATGLGKTVVFAEVARRFRAQGERVLVLAGRDELLKQAQRKLADVGLDGALDKGSVRAPDNAAVVVASVQTLRGARLERYAPDAFGLVVCDEAHHAMALGHRTILRRFERAKLLGVTATPDRLDGRGLGDVFGSVAYRYDLREAIRAAWLAPISARRIVIESVDLSQIKTRAGDLAADQLAEVMKTEKAIHGVVVPLLVAAGDRPTLVFAVDVAHAHALADRLCSYRAGCARALDGDTNADTRAAMVAEFEAGAFQFLVNCAVLTEGFDAPATACIALARPTKSRALVTQMIGRGTRLHPGKRDCLVLDFTGNVGKHRLVGPADALAGHEIGEDVRAELYKLLRMGVADLDVALTATELGVAELRREVELRAVVKFFDQEIDPFVGGLARAEVEFVDQPCWRGRATDKQLAALDAAGVPASKLPIGLTMGDAHRILTLLDRRKAAGLCSYSQAKLIAKSGIDTRTLTAKRAREMVLRLKAHNWVPWALHNEPEASHVRAARSSLHGER